MNNLDKDIKILEELKNKKVAINSMFYYIGIFELDEEDKQAISNVLSELERYKRYYEEQNEVNKKFVSKDKFDEVNTELETYKKIAEKLAHYIWQYDCCEYEIGKNGKCKCYYIDKDCTEKCIMEWARKEVEKDE